MGVEIIRFLKDSVDEDLICQICHGVFVDPVQTPCRHLFCKQCIEEWIQQNETCPSDRSFLCTQLLTKAPFAIQNIIGRLPITCVYQKNGCTYKTLFNNIKRCKDHEKECLYSPKSKITSTCDCGFVAPLKGFMDHDCMDYLQNRQKNLKTKLIKQTKDYESLRSNLEMKILRMKLLFYLFVSGFIVLLLSLNVSYAPFKTQIN